MTDPTKKIDNFCKRLSRTLLVIFLTFENVTIKPGYAKILRSNPSSVKDACGGVFTNDMNGSFTSPSFPDFYPGNKNCVWQIETSLTSKITIRFTHFDIEGNDNPQQADCENDKVEVYSKIAGGKFQKHGSYCGTQAPQAITSVGNIMRIVLSSDSSVEKTGFEATFFTDACGGVFSKVTNGTIKFPMFKDMYELNQKCVWEIEAEPQRRVSLEFIHFDTEPHDKCNFDKVDVYSIIGEETLKKHGTYCGTKMPARIVSDKNVMKITFSSDQSNVRTGFIANFYTDVCGGIFTNETNGTITSPSFPDFYSFTTDCIWEIRALPHHRIMINFTHFEIEGNNESQQQDCPNDKIDIFSQINQTLYKHGTYCGPKAPQPIGSERNVMTIVFTTHSIVQRIKFAANFLTDLDECSINNGGCQHECINTFGSYICTCQRDFILHADGHNCTLRDCRYDVSEPYGTISSPNYPNIYPPNVNCAWNFTMTPGHRIVLVFHTFDLESSCSYDHLDIYDGPSTQSIKLGMYCGSDMPRTVSSINNQLYVTFKTDGSVFKAGFLATHFTLCGGHLTATAEKQHFYSHANFGNGNYENHVVCDWKIQSQHGGKVKLTFLTFDVGDKNDCLYDYVEIFDGVNSNATTFGRFCEAKKPFDIISTGSTVFVSFRADNLVAHGGFNLMYKEANDADVIENVVAVN